MALYVVTVESEEHGEQFEVAVLAWGDRSAKLMATKTVRKTCPDARSTDIRQVDHFKTGVVLTRRLTIRE